MSELEIFLGVLSLLEAYHIIIAKRNEKAIAKLYDLDRTQTKDISIMENRLTKIETKLKLIHNEIN